MDSSLEVVRRARILAVQRSGAHKYRRELKALDLLVDSFPNSVGKNKIMAMMSKPVKTDETGRDSWVSTVQGEIRQCLEQTSVRLVNKQSRELELVVIERSDRNGYVFDALQFPFYLDWETPSPNSLNQICIQWITEDGCAACVIKKKGWCSNDKRHFTPNNLPKEVKLLMNEVSKKLPFNNTVLRLLKMEAPFGQNRTRPTMNIVACKQRFSTFRATCLALQDHNIWKLMGLPEAGSKESMGACQVFDAGFNNIEHSARRLGQNLGFTIWVTQIDDNGAPVAALLSWRKGREAKSRGATLLEVGYGEYHAGASSQIKLGPRAKGLNDHRLSGQQWELPNLENAVLQELELETALSQRDVVGKPILLGTGWLQEYWHPEVLVLVQTKRDLKSLPWKPADMIESKIKHYDEFRRKMIVPFHQQDLLELARYLVGLPPIGVQIEQDPTTGKEPTWVRWSPQGAVAAILAYQWYFQETETLRKAVADVIEAEVKAKIKFSFPNKKKSVSVKKR